MTTIPQRAETATESASTMTELYKSRRGNVLRTQRSGLASGGSPLELVYHTYVRRRGI